MIFYQIKRLLTRTIRMRDETYRWWKIREEWHAPWRPVISVVRVASVLVHRRVGGGRHITVTHLRHRDVFRLKTIREHFLIIREHLRLHSIRLIYRTVHFLLLRVHSHCAKAKIFFDVWIFFLWSIPTVLWSFSLSLLLSLGVNRDLPAVGRRGICH